MTNSKNPAFHEKNHDVSGNGTSHKSLILIVKNLSLRNITLNTRIRYIQIEKTFVYVSESDRCSAFTAMLDMVF